MRMVAERDSAYFDKSKGTENHDHDLIHELGKRLDALLRYDQYIDNARGDAELQDFWRSLKQQEQDNVKRFKEFVAGRIEKMSGVKIVFNPHLPNMQTPPENPACVFYLTTFILTRVTRDGWPFAPARSNGALPRLRVPWRRKTPAARDGETRLHARGDHALL